MISKRAINLASTRVACLAAILLCSSNCFGQARATVPGQEATFDGQSVTIDYNEDRGRQGTFGGPISSIDVAGAQFSPDAFPHPSIYLTCKGGVNCFDGTVHYAGMVVIAPGERMGNSSSAGNYMNVNCSSVSECEAFLQALRAAALPKAGSANNRATDARKADRTETQAQQARVQPPQPRTPPPVALAPSVPTQRAPSPSDNGFRDVLDGITWNKGNGTQALDDAVKQTKPSPSPPRPPAQRPTFAAFAQSAGFDANQGFGFATGSDLNDTVGRANSNCVSYAKTSCGDEGYCMLRPGLWGAWASDRKYLGSKAFACNLATQDEAIDQAATWCGFGCEVLWTGFGQ